jgi:hypothetical protein
MAVSGFGASASLLDAPAKVAFSIAAHVKLWPVDVMLSPLRSG